MAFKDTQRKRHFSCTILSEAFKIEVMYKYKIWEVTFCFLKRCLVKAFAYWSIPIMQMKKAVSIPSLVVLLIHYLLGQDIDWGPQCYQVDKSGAGSLRILFQTCLEKRCSIKGIASDTTRITTFFSGCQELFKTAVPILAMPAFRKLFCFYSLLY